MTTKQKLDQAMHLLRNARSLGLTFDRGTAYISRSYVDTQETLCDLIDALERVEPADGQPVNPDGVRRHVAAHSRWYDMALIEDAERVEANEWAIILYGVHREGIGPVDIRYERQMDGWSPKVVTAVRTESETEFRVWNEDVLDMPSALSAVDPITRPGMEQRLAILRAFWRHAEEVAGRQQRAWSEGLYDTLRKATGALFPDIVA